MQRRCKHAFPTIEKPCFLRGPYKVVVKKSSVETSRVESSFETTAHQDMSLEAEELNCVEYSELEVQNVAKKGVRLCREDFKCDSRRQ
jgi:hypothetical protein